MHPSSYIILNSFLGQIPEERREGLIRLLPESTENTLKTLGEPLQIELSPFSFDWLLGFVHYSWLMPTLKLYSKDAPFFVSALENGRKMNLQTSMEIPASATTLSPFAEDFFRDVLINSLVGEKNTLLPLEYLPESELNILTQFSKKEMTQLIDFLSLYDLALEIRQIVETKILKKIYSLLTEDQKKFLKSIMAQKEHPALTKLGLDRWDGNEEVFRHLLHRRGLMRLGIALSREHPDLLWYVCHILDIGRGTALSKSAQKEAKSHLAQAISQNIMELVPLIHK